MVFSTRNDIIVQLLSRQAFCLLSANMECDLVKSAVFFICLLLDITNELVMNYFKFNFLAG